MLIMESNLQSPSGLGQALKGMNKFGCRAGIYIYRD